VLVITTALVVLYALGTTRTVIGPQIYAVGGNAEARISRAFRHQD
jgi:ABC-type xylose transport system permease subunit